MPNCYATISVMVRLTKETIFIYQLKDFFMKRILYLLLISAPIFSMQQDASKEANNNVRAYGKTGALATVLYSASSPSIISVATTPTTIVGTSCFPTIGISPVVGVTIIVVNALYNKFNERYEIRERSSIPLNKESSSIPKRSTGE